jgi:release factor glutamine methyltransferase
MPEVARYEPRTALDGGADGFDAYRRLFPVLPQFLTRPGVAILELGAGQAATAKTLAEQANFSVKLRPDLAGIPRALVLRPTPP